MEEVLEIRTIEDLERILLERADWKERIRRLILTEELMNLPSKFDNFVKNDFIPLKEKADSISNDVTVLKEDVAVLKEDVAVLKEDVAILKEDVAKLKEDVNMIKDDVGDLKGGFLELKVRDKIGAFLGKLLKKVKLIDFSELADSLYEAMDKEIITNEELDNALEIDAVAEGYLRKSNGKKVLVAVEVSHVIDKRDVDRAFKRAKIIYKAYQIECIPVAIGKKITKGAKILAEEKGVLLI